MHSRNRSVMFLLQTCVKVVAVLCEKSFCIRRLIDYNYEALSLLIYVQNLNHEIWACQIKYLPFEINTINI